MRHRCCAADRAGVTTAQSANDKDTDSSADELVRQALKAEIDGDSQRRAAYLADALAADPDNAPAHWHSGEVRTGDHWTTIAAAADATRQAGKVAEYRHKREHVANAVQGQIAMARWCAGVGLPSEAKVHWTMAMQASPTKKQTNEIAPKIGLMRHRGTLMPSGLVDAMHARSAQMEKLKKAWKPLLVQWRRNLEGHDKTRREAALHDLRTLRDPELIPILFGTFADFPTDVHAAIVEGLANTPGQEATDALIQTAIAAEDNDLRTAAANALKTRSLFSYVPTMMSALQSTVEVQFESSFANGQYRHRLALYQEGPLADQMIVSAGGSTTDIVENHSIRSGRITNRVIYKPDRVAERDGARAQQELDLNVVRQETNARIAESLQIATGNDFAPDPKVLWKWWLDYNEIYQPTYKPVSQQVYDSTPAPVTYRVTYASCFPAGTPVETSTGTLTIEQIKPGDCVLAQDPDSGELAYKPIMAVTVRPPSPLIEVRTEKDTIRERAGIRSGSLALVGKWPRS